MYGSEKIKRFEMFFCFLQQLNQCADLKVGIFYCFNSDTHNEAVM